ncbi:MAG TPA: hypothetical protein VF516_17310, partial [Kofleriaceae bacterium]
MCRASRADAPRSGENDPQQGAAVRPTCGRPARPARGGWFIDDRHQREDATQARVRATRYPTDERVCWMPAGRHDRTAVLPLSGRMPAAGA